MRVPGQKFFVPANKKTIAGMARTYKDKFICRFLWDIWVQSARFLRKEALNKFQLWFDTFGRTSKLRYARFPFVLSTVRSTVYRRIERKTPMKLLAIRLGCQTTAAKSLVITTNGFIQRSLTPSIPQRQPCPAPCIVRAVVAIIPNRLTAQLRCTDQNRRDMVRLLRRAELLAPAF